MSSPPPPRRGGMDDELARKKRELEELNEMIAYKKSLVDLDPRGLDPGQRTCIDYDHGRIAVPLKEYKPVRSILKKRPESSEYHYRSPSLERIQPYDDHYYDGPYRDPYQNRRYGDPYGDRYGDPYGSRPYPDRPYSDLSYDKRLYAEPSYGVSQSTSQRYTDRYEVYDEPYEDRYYDPTYVDRPADDPYRSTKQSHSDEPRDASPSSQSSQASAATSSTQPTYSKPVFRPPSPTESPPRSPSPKRKNSAPRESPPAEKPPLDRFLAMLNKKVDAEKKAGQVQDDLLPHERAVHDGKGFSRIVGMAQEHPSSSARLESAKKESSPNRFSVDRTSEDSESKSEPYDKIQSLLRTIGMKLSTGEVSKLASRAQEKLYTQKSSSSERDTLPSHGEQRGSRTGSVESNRTHSHSPSPARSSSREQLSRCTAVSEYEGFLDQQELQALKKAQQMQSLTKTMGSTSTGMASAISPPFPPSAQYQCPPPPNTWHIGVTKQQTPPQSSPSSSRVNPSSPVVSEPLQRFGPPRFPPSEHSSPKVPPGPPPGPPPRYPAGRPPFVSVLPFLGQVSAAPPPSSSSSSPSQPNVAVTGTPGQSAAKAIKSVQFNLPSEAPSGSSLQSVETDEDVKAKQKEKVKHSTNHIWHVESEKQERTETI